jgi:alcohol dehydrogenase
LSSFENHLPRRVITRRGASQSLAAVCQTNGWSRVFVVSDAGVAGAGLLWQVALPLRAETVAEVPPEPPIELVDAIAARIKASGAEAVIALGGGSVMDAAKVASLCVRHGKAAREFVGIGKAGGRGLPTVLIPTTAGTGSEATFVALLTDPATGNKVGVVDPCILAGTAIVDPTLTDGLAAQVTASAGMDALVQPLRLSSPGWPRRWRVDWPWKRRGASGARWKWSAASQGTVCICLPIVAQTATKAN